MAGPAVGSYLSDPVSGRAAREDTRCWARAEPRHLRGDRGEARRRQGSAGAVGRAGGRGKILAAGSDGAEEPRGAGYFHRLCGRAEGITASDRDRLSQSAGAAVHRPLSAELPQLRFLAGAQSSSGRPEADLSCGNKGGRRATAGVISRELGWSVSEHQPDLAPELGAGDTIFRLPGGDPEGHLHYQRSGVSEHEPAQGDQNAGLVSERRSSLEAAVPGPGSSGEEMDAAGTGLESGAESIWDFVRGPAAARGAGMISEIARGRVGAAMWRECPVLRFALNARPAASQGEAAARALPPHGIGGRKPEAENYRLSESRLTGVLSHQETTFTQNS